MSAAIDATASGQKFARSDLVAAARQSILCGSKSFAAASRLFAPEVRERAWLLYAWCRAADDLVDGQTMGHGPVGATDPAAALAEVRSKTAAVLAGIPSGDAAFDAMGVVAREADIPATLAHDVIDGFALDVDGFTPLTQADMERYCYHVAGAVGVMMAMVMGVPPTDQATLDRACDLGIAFQLANISRDMIDDAQAGRCYLPQDWLNEEGLTPADLVRTDARPAMARISIRLADLAQRYAASGRSGAAALSPRSAWAVLAAAGIYGDIAVRVAERGENAWSNRIGTGALGKLGWIIRSAAGVARRGRTPPADRSGLWTRPRADQILSPLNR